MTQLLAFLSAHAAEITLVVTTVCALVTAWLKHRGADRSDRITSAVVAGTRVGLADIALGKDPVLAVVDGITAAAKVHDVEDHVGDHLDAISAPADEGKPL